MQHATATRFINVVEFLTVYLVIYSMTGFVHYRCMPSLVCAGRETTPIVFCLKSNSTFEVICALKALLTSSSHSSVSYFPHHSHKLTCPSLKRLIYASCFCAEKAFQPCVTTFHIFVGVKLPGSFCSCC